MFEPANIISVLRNAPGNINGTANNVYVCTFVTEYSLENRFSQRHQRLILCQLFRAKCPVRDR